MEKRRTAIHWATIAARSDDKILLRKREIFIWDSFRMDAFMPNPYPTQPQPKPADPKPAPVKDPPAPPSQDPVEPPETPPDPPPRDPEPPPQNDPPSADPVANYLAACI
jgi:hypothetical protein